MIGLILLLLLIIFILVIVFWIKLSIRWARKKEIREGKSFRKYLFIYLGIPIAILTWDYIPSRVLLLYYCNASLYNRVNVTPEEWVKQFTPAQLTAFQIGNLHDIKKHKLYLFKDRKELPENYILDSSMMEYISSSRFSHGCSSISHFFSIDEAVCSLEDKQTNTVLAESNSFYIPKMSTGGGNLVPNTLRFWHGTDECFIKDDVHTNYTSSIKKYWDLVLGPFNNKYNLTDELPEVE